jgi:hypothetical protein
MATSEERMKILKMIQEGRISPEDAVQLLRVLEPQAADARRGRGPVSPPGVPNMGSASGRWFRVMVTDTKSGRARVNVRLPASMVSAGMKLGARFAPQVEGLEAGKLMEYLNSGMVGKIVDVFDEEDGEHVEVFIE